MEPESTEKRTIPESSPATGVSAGTSEPMSKCQCKRHERHAQILALLQENSRISLTKIARTLRLPVSTVFDHVKVIERTHVFACVPREDAPRQDHEWLPYGWRCALQRKEARITRIAMALRYNARKPTAKLARELKVAHSTLAYHLPLLEQRYRFSLEPREPQPTFYALSRHGPFPLL